MNKQPGFDLNLKKKFEEEKKASPFSQKRSVSNNSNYQPSRLNKDKGYDLSDPIAVTDF